MIIGALTGGIASGKSQVLKEAGTFPDVETIQADDLAKEIYNPDNPCFQEVVDLFGPEVLTAEGSVDKGKLSDIVFSDPGLLRELEKISHPYVKGRIEGILECLKEKNIRMMLVEIPLLFQSSNVKFDIFDLVILVRASEEDQLKRLINRDGVSAKAAKRRIELQSLPDSATERSDFVIDAGCSLEETRKQTRDLMKELLD